MHKLLILVVITGIVTAQDRGTLTLRQALESTLARHPLLGVQQQQVAFRQGVRRQISGAFDRQYQSGAQQSYSHSLGEGVNATTLDLAVTKLYRNGISAGPVASLSRTRSNLLTPDGLSESHLAYEMTVPLLRSLGRQAAAQETSAGIDVDAARLDLNQTASDLLTETATRYWELRGALDLLEVSIGSERRGQTFLDTTQTLIDADRIPRNDLNLVRANLADRVATRIGSEQNVIAARSALGYAIGLEPQELAQIADPAADPSDVLPAAVDVPGADAASLRVYVAIALERRTDYQASQRRIAAARELVSAAENQTRPSIDFVLSTGYSGLRTGAAPTSTLAALFRGVSGADAVAGVRYQFAPSNNAAQGRLSQALVAVKQAELESADLARSITAAVTVAAQAVRNAALRLERARESVAAFQEALTAERDKYTLGFSSLVDILTTEDRLTQALGVQVRAQLDYARELARLRRATGTIVAPDADLTAALPVIDDQQFRMLPR